MKEFGFDGVGYGYGPPPLLYHYTLGDLRCDGPMCWSDMMRAMVCSDHGEIVETEEAIEASWHRRQHHRIARALSRAFYFPPIPSERPAGSR